MDCDLVNFAIAKYMSHVTYLSGIQIGWITEKVNQCVTAIGYEATKTEIEDDFYKFHKRPVKGYGTGMIKIGGEVKK